MERYNRVEAAFERWEEDGRKFEKKFPGSLAYNKEYVKERLYSLESLQARFAASATTDERRYLIGLNQSRKDLIKALYPNPLLRLLRNLLQPYRQKVLGEQFLSQSLVNEKALREKVDAIGFGDVQKQLSNHLRQGKESFSIPVSNYVGEKDRMDFSLEFSRNQNGEYDLNGYKASLYNGGNAATGHFFQVGEDKTIDRNQAYNLLSGRPILEYDAITQKPAWMSFNLNDKDADGNFRMRVLPADLNNIEKEIKLAGISAKTDVDNIMASFRVGGEYPMGLGRESFKASLNPYRNTIELRNKAGQKTTVQHAVDRNKPVAKKVPLEKTKQQNRKQKTRISKGISK